MTSESFRVRGPENWPALLRTGANMLVVGARSALDAFVNAALDDMSEPVWLLGPAQEIPTEQTGTFVLYDASKLDELQQKSLVDLLATDVPRVQVISLSEHHLWRGDRASSIQTDLYYRLNTICLEIEPHPLSLHGISSIGLPFPTDSTFRVAAGRGRRTIRAEG